VTSGGVPLESDEWRVVIKTIMDGSAGIRCSIWNILAMTGGQTVASLWAARAATRWRSAPGPVEAFVVGRCLSAFRRTVGDPAKACPERSYFDRLRMSVEGPDTTYVKMHGRDPRL